MEYTLVMVKPDHVHLAQDILHILDQHATRVKTATVNAVPLEVIQKHYEPHKEKLFFGYMTAYFENKSVVVAVYEGEEVIRRFRELTGDQDPCKAAPHSIRGLFSRDSLEEAIAEERPVKNVLHASDSVAEAQREVEVWKAYLDLGS